MKLSELKEFKNVIAPNFQVPKVRPEKMGVDLKWELRTPCKSCPYRKDVEPGMWHRSEFESLLAHDKNEMEGFTFGCHKYRERPKSEFRYCAGWLMDQHERGMPSIQLRLAAMQGGKVVRDCLDSLHDDGNELYGSIEEMCEANHVYPKDAQLKL